MRWTEKVYTDGKYIEIPNYQQDSNINILDITEENENKVEEINDRVQMTYDPTRDYVTDILLVGGTDESYEALEKFEEALNNENPY